MAVLQTTKLHILYHQNQQQYQQYQQQQQLLVVMSLVFLWLKITV
jgi:hypothetical protein